MILLPEELPSSLGRRVQPPRYNHHHTGVLREKVQNALLLNMTYSKNLRLKHYSSKWYTQPTQSSGNQHQFLLCHVKQIGVQDILNRHRSHGIDACGSRTVKKRLD